MAAPADAARRAPLLSTQNALLAVGTACLAGMVHFYKRKHTAGFKACWALMWPTLGGGVMLAVQPDPDQAVKVRGSHMSHVLCLRHVLLSDTCCYMQRLAACRPPGGGPAK